MGHPLRLPARILQLVLQVDGLVAVHQLVGHLVLHARLAGRLDLAGSTCTLYTNTLYFVPLGSRTWSRYGQIRILRLYQAPLQIQWIRIVQVGLAQEVMIRATTSGQ